MRLHKVLGTTVDLDCGLAVTGCYVHQGKPTKHVPRASFEVEMMFKDKPLVFQVWDKFAERKCGPHFLDSFEDIYERASDATIEMVMSGHSQLLDAWQKK